MQYSIIPYNNILPNIHKSVYIAQGARIIGDAIIEQNSSIWFNVVIRADVSKVNIGQATNIQDGTVIHASRYNGPTIIGSNVTVGHNATIHAVILKDYAFIGMNSVIMDKAIVREFGFVAAGALIAPGKIVGSYQLWAGIPAKYIRDITTSEIEMIQNSSSHYIELAQKYKSI
ncbi:hexapeptide transferase family protein [Orientia chuto str. Dubai]|uniref:Hexapeptide transferase family protein n=1 Tax=Orientia chuto str. Dubai TaxID=1359168 RepID=A0A0F3MNM0_9RICK|nr:gamma carbonic anhydrase family protein [Candidatus Orientia mediorientalis]KJV57256.1 hexapeptide transferase family protein [Orientia chuto str. Dubai]